MRVDLFDYELPADRIAQHPVEPRDASRLLVLDRRTGRRQHRQFHHVGEFLHPGDVLVVNDTRVIPARLLGRRQKTGGAWEGLFLREIDGVWELMTKTRGKPAAGEFIEIARSDNRRPASWELELLEKTTVGTWLARATVASPALSLLLDAGRVPLPNYIREGAEGPGDRDRYQTVYAHEPGAVAAPTAGLHFTQQLLDELLSRGIHLESVTLHVGPGTFQPVSVDDTRDHKMHSEWCEISADVALRLNGARDTGGRIVAVGTTSVRTLETASRATGRLVSYQGATDLFICEPYEFRAVDAIVTNFHLPRSTLLMLVCAFAGRDMALDAYRDAIAKGYRFYSYGDAMLIG